MNKGISFSHYSLLLECLRKYKHVVIDGLPSGLESSGDVQFGSTLHAAINEILEKGDGEQVFSIMWESYNKKDLDYGRFDWQKLNELGLNFLSKFKRLHAKKFKLHQAEKRLYSDYKGVKLEGTPDFIGEYEGLLSIRDFKTSGANYPKEKSLVALQLNLYSYLSISQLGFVPETLGYDVFNKSTGSIQSLTWQFNEKLMYEHLDTLISYVGKLQNGEYEKNVNSCVKGSYVCPFYNRCWK